MAQFYSTPTTIDQLLDLSDRIGVTDFETFIAKFLERKADKKAAIKELDTMLSNFNNFAFNFHLYLKQNYLFKKVELAVAVSSDYLTKKEIAQRFKVNIRTVTNWINDGLEIVEIGGVVRVSRDSLKKFIQTAGTKKFAWKSILQPPLALGDI